MEGELDTVKIEGERTLLHHNLDMLISLFHGTGLNKLFINHELTDSTHIWLYHLITYIVCRHINPEVVWKSDGSLLWNKFES